MSLPIYFVHLIDGSIVLIGLLAVVRVTTLDWVIDLFIPESSIYKQICDEKINHSAPDYSLEKQSGRIGGLISSRGYQ